MLRHVYPVITFKPVGMVLDQHFLSRLFSKCSLDHVHVHLLFYEQYR